MRERLLKWFPFLGPCHRLFHAALQWGHRGVAAFAVVFTRFRFNQWWEARIRRAAQKSENQPFVKPIVHLYSVCWNEERILPHFMAYYRSFVDQFTFYDNGSTDSTLKLLAAYPNVTVVETGRGGVFDEGANLNIKNTAWKASAGKADFVVVCDMDEFLFHPHVSVLLTLMKKHGFTVLKPCGFQMVSEHLPAYDGKTLLTEFVTTGVEDAHNYSKTVLFDPNRITEIHFSPGCHRSRPEGIVKIFRSDHAKLLHYKYVDRGEILRKMRTYRETLSAESRERGWGGHYQKKEDEILAYFDAMLAAGRKVV